MTAFTGDLITPAKRVTRAAQYEMASWLLHARQRIRCESPSVLMLAGMKPEEEIGCLRAIFRAPFITAIDVDELCVERARNAGADRAIVCDLIELGAAPTNPMRNGPLAMEKGTLNKLTKFDLICLDLCGHLEGEMLDAVRSVVSRCLATAGVLIVNCSYGRDNPHYNLALARGGHRNGEVPEGTRKAVDAMLKGGGREESVEAMAGRLMSISRALPERLLLEQVLFYQGHKTPMVSTLWHIGPSLLEMRHSLIDGSPWNAKIVPPTWPRNDLGRMRTKFLKIEDADLDLLVEATRDPAPLYATSVDKVLAIRRSTIARKAVATRKACTDDGCSCRCHG